MEAREREKAASFELPSRIAGNVVSCDCIRKMSTEIKNRIYQKLSKIKFSITFSELV